MIRFPVICALFLIVCGCAPGVQYSDTTIPARLNQENSEQTTRVLAKAEEWRNSGVVVEKGGRYLIKASGRWRPGGLCNWTGPDGITPYTPLCLDLGGQTVRGYSHSALIAKIGDQGEPFGVGNEFELLAKEGGVLYFRMNDTPGFFWDNEGHVDVRIALMDKPQAVTAAPKEPEPKPASDSTREEQAKKLYQEGNAYFEAKSYKEAVDVYKKAIELAAQFAPLYYNLAMAQIELGQKVEAISNLNRYLELRPNAQNAREVKDLIKSLTK